VNTQLPGPLVSATWLAEHLTAPDVKIIDASWFLPGEERNPVSEFEETHIEGAVFFDIDVLRDPDNPLPHMLPHAQHFGEQLAHLGISNGDLVIAYDSVGLFSAPRAWWTLRVFGHDRVAVLDGGLPAWRALGLATCSGPALPDAGIFDADYRPELVRDLAQMLSNVQTNSEQVIDARGHGRFVGSEPEVRPGLRSGHIPGSANLPYSDLIDANNKSLLPAEKIEAALAKRGIDLTRPVVTTCGSGISASLLALALFTCGHSAVAVYDGSWTEWGGRDDTPLETG